MLSLAKPHCIGDMPCYIHAKQILHKIGNIYELVFDFLKTYIVLVTPLPNYGNFLKHSGLKHSAISKEDFFSTILQLKVLS